MVVSLFFCFKQKTAYEMRISDWSSDVCSSDLAADEGQVLEAVDALDVEHRPVRRELGVAGQHLGDEGPRRFGVVGDPARDAAHDRRRGPAGVDRKSVV